MITVRGRMCCCWKRTSLDAVFAAVPAAELGASMGLLPPAAGQIIVGSANFPESELLMNIYAGAIKAKGVQVSTKPNIGSRETYLPALKDGSINVVPEYTGVLATYFDKNAKAKAPDEVYEELEKALPAEYTVLEMSPAEDKDAVVVTRETATQHNLKAIGDLAPVAGDMVLGGPPEWKTRPTGVPGLDAIMGGGLPEFSFNIIAGSPGCGKTTLAHALALSIPAIFVTILIDRMLRG